MILKVISSTPPVFIEGKSNLNEARLASQLIHDGCLRGDIAEDSQGRPVSVAILDVTIEGRKLCEQFEEDIRNSRFTVKAGKTIKKGTLLLFAGIAGMIGGIMGSVITEVVLRKTGLK